MRLSGLGFTGAILGRAFFQWCIVLFLARLGGAEELGAYATALSLTSPVVIFAELGYRNIYAAQSEVPRFVVAFGTRFAFLGIASATVLVCGHFLLGMDPAILGAFMLWKAAESFLDLTFVVDQRRGKMNGPARAIIISSAIGTASFCVAYWLGLGLAMSVAVMACLTFIVLLSSLPTLLKKIGKDPTLSKGGNSLMWLLKAGSATGGGQAIGSLGAYLPVLFLAASGDQSAVGQYSVLSYFLVVSHLVLSSFQQVRLNAARSLFGKPEQLFWNAMRGNLLVAGLMAAGTLAFLEFGLTYVYGAEFYSTAFQSLILLAAILVLPISYASATVMLIEGRFKSQLFSTLGALVFAAVFMAWPRNGDALTVGIEIMAVYVWARAIVGMALISAPLVRSHNELKGHRQP